MVIVVIVINGVVEYGEVYEDHVNGEAVEFNEVDL